MKNSLPVEPPKDSTKERQYRAEEGLRALEHAESFRKDKDAMRDIKKLAKQKAKSLSKIR